MIKKLLKKYFAKKENMTLTEDITHIQFVLATITVVFFGFGYLFDSIVYLKDSNWLMFCLNMAVLIFIIGTLIIQHFKKKKESRIYRACYAVITINLVSSIWYYILSDIHPDTNFMRISILCFLLILSSGFLLSKDWTRVYLAIYLINYFVCLFYTHSQNLIDNAFVIPLIFIGLAYWSRIFLKLHEKSVHTALEYKEKSVQLSNLLNSDKQLIHRKIEYFYDQNKQKNLKLEDEINAIAKIMKYNLNDLVDEHSMDISSAENLFVNRILEKHPTITAGELKLAYMLVRNMNTKEIMESTGKAENTVRVYRYRLRKKMDIQPKMSLMHYLKQFES